MVDGAAGGRQPISVVVPTRDRPEHLETCLLALNHVLRPGDELIVVDSASRDDRSEKIVAPFAARYIRCDVPGASHARNVGWTNATHPIVAFVDDDVHVHEGWADAIACCASDHPEAGFISTKIGHPPSEFGTAVMLHPDPFWIDKETPVPIGHSASVAVPRHVLVEVGGFDESLGAGGRFRAAEDQDLFDRIFSAGYRGWYEPRAFAIHQNWRERRDVLRNEWSYGIGSGARIAKLIKRDRGRVRKVIDENIAYCFKGMAHAIKVRYKFLFLVLLGRLFGACVGVTRALFTPVRHDHFGGRPACVASARSSPPWSPVEPHPQRSDSAPPLHSDGSGG